MVSAVEATGEPQAFTFDIVFQVGRLELHRVPIVVNIPPAYDDGCESRPPVILEVNVPAVVGAGEVAEIDAAIDDPHDDIAGTLWSAIVGTFFDASDALTEWTAPPTEGLAELTFTVTDETELSDTAHELVLVAGGACTGDPVFADLGLHTSDLLLEAPITQDDATGSCGEEEIGQALFVLRVHNPGSWTIDSPETSPYTFFITEADCTTEIACARRRRLPLSVDLDAGEYLLFVDSSLEEDVRIRIGQE